MFLWCYYGVISIFSILAASITEVTVATAAIAATPEDARVGFTFVEPVPEIHSLNF